jgi:hypothetical protein
LPKKIVPLRRRSQLNIGIVILGVFLLYIVFTVARYMGRTKVTYYEVAAGDIVKNTEHTGLILRDETVMYASDTGYVNYFITAGKRVSVGSSVYSLDETGGLSQYLQNNSLNNVSMSDDDLRTIRKQLSGHSSSFSDENFSAVYTVRSYVDSAVLEYSGMNTLENLDQLLAGTGITYTCERAPYTGILGLDIDGYEGLAAESVTADNFDRTGYRYSHVKSGAMVEKDAPVYKIIRSEEWSIVMQLTEEERLAYSSYTSLPITFSDKNIHVNAPYYQFTGVDGNYYGKLSLSKYMVDFFNERFVTFDIDVDSSSGLKIPKTSVISKTFLTIPYDYLTKGGDGIGDGFLKQIYIDGVQYAQFTEVELYYNDGEKYYIDMSIGSPLQPGDVILKPETNEELTLVDTATLSGVYNINKGYAVFKQIEVIDSNDEYYIIRRNQRYGLNVYDHILLDPTGVSEGDFVYE